MGHEHHTTDDRIAAGVRPPGGGGGPRRAAGLRLQVQPQGLHPAPARRPPGRQAVPQGRLPRPGRLPGRLGRAAPGAGPKEGPPLHHAAEGPVAPRKKTTDALLTATAAPRPAPPVRAAVDSTGYDARPVSHYFVRRAGRRGRQRHWPKLTAVVDTRTHLFLSASVTRAPSQDAAPLVPAVRRAAGRVAIDPLLADAGYDSEANHATCREQLGVRSTVIALNWRGSRKWPGTRYRRQMVRRFRKKPRGSRHRRGCRPPGAAGGGVTPPQRPPGGGGPPPP